MATVSRTHTPTVPWWAIQFRPTRMRTESPASKVVVKIATTPEAKVTGRDIAGLPLELEKFRGKVVVLAFWSAGDAQAKQTNELLTKLYKQNLGRPVELLGVSRDSDAVLRELKAQKVLPWRNFADGDGKVSEAYRVRKVPQVYVLTRMA